MPIPKLILLAVLSGVSLLLLGAFFVVYFGGETSEPLELTAASSANIYVQEGNTLSNKPGTSIHETRASEDRTTGDHIAELRVYIAGAVRSPGVYTVQAGDRLVDVIEAAEGTTAMADLEAVNLAVRVEDEGYYYIPPKGTRPADSGNSEPESATRHSPPVPALATVPLTGDQSRGDAEPGAPSEAEESPVNLNTASQPQLETLPGIGPIRAKAIISYREQNGQFSAIEEITAVSGIGQGIYENIRHLITVAP